MIREFQPTFPEPQNIDWGNYTFQDIVNIVGAKTTLTEEKSIEVIGKIRETVRRYVKKNKLQSLVLGVSGGLDSSVIAALCQEKYTGVPLIGISIPMSSSIAHKEQAQWVGDNYCTAFEEFQGWDEDWGLDGEAGAYGATTNMMSEVFSTVNMTDKLAEKAGFKIDVFPTNILEGNIKARLRMITLYDLARKTNGMVMSTDNLSEFQMAFWTINGDVGDYGPIQNIGKGFELPAIAKALNIREDIITQAPSDGLMVTEENTDEAQLGANYKEVDAIMTIYLDNMPVPIEDSLNFKEELDIIIQEKKEGYEKIINIIDRYNNFSYKRTGTINLSRQEIGIINNFQ